MHTVLMSKLPIAALAAALSIGCSAPGKPAAAPAKASQAPRQKPTAKVNLNEIFPPGRGRELVLNNCTSCHTFVPIVILQMTKEAWERNSRDHRGRVASLSNADFQVLYQYLETNFGPHKPVPALPRELLDTWTSY